LEAFRGHDSLVEIVAAELTDSLDGVVLVREFFDIGALVQLKVVTESDFAKQHQLALVATVGVRCTLGEQIREIKAFPKHVAGRGRFWWCDPESLRQYAEHVGHRSTVEEQASVLKVLVFFIAFVFPFSRHFKQIELFVLHLLITSIDDELLD
jgi:phage-related protein